MLDRLREALRRHFQAASLLELFPLLMGAVSFALGTVVITGWYAHVRILVQPIPDFVPMQFNTAVCFVLVGAATLSGRCGLFGLSACCFAGLLATLNLIQTLAQVNLGIDELFVTHFITTNVTHPGRMAPNTSVAFMLLATSVAITVGRRESHIFLTIASLLSTLSAVLGLVALAGYLGNVETNYGWGQLAKMAPNTAFGLVVLSCGVTVAVIRKRRSLDNSINSVLPILAGFVVATASVLMWRSLSALEDQYLEDASEAASIAIKDRLETRLQDVVSALSRMADRVGYQWEKFDAEEWKLDAGNYLDDHVGYELLMVTDKALRPISAVSTISSEVALQERISASLRRAFPQGLPGEPVITRKGLLNSSGSNFYITVPVLQGLEHSGYVIALVAASPFLHEVLDYNFVVPGFALTGYDGFVELVQRGRSLHREIWQKSTEVHSHGAVWLFSTWPEESTAKANHSLLPLVVLVGGVVLSGFVTMLLYLGQVARRSLEEAEAVTLTKSNFLANMSHEIRSPLTTVLGFTESMIAEELPRHEQLRALTIMRQNGSHLLQVINDILDLSKVEAGRMELEVMNCSLRDLLSDVQASMKLKASEKGLLFVDELQFPLPAVVRTDPTKLKQILINLIGNAIKFTTAGKVVLKVRHDESSLLLYFDVIDTGIGIAPTDLEKLFTPFTQADDSTTRRFGGTGLGLTISKHYAERLGGTVTVSTSAGSGSTFTASIHVGAVAPEDFVYELNTAGVDSLPGKVEEVPRLKGKVLIAEDSENNREFLSFLLRKTGLTTVFAADGAAAVEKARNETFDLILMDMQMPVLDGFSATTILRRAGLTIPIVALTANAMADDVQRCLSAGCSGHLGKPFTRKKFFELLSAHLPMDSDFIDESDDDDEEQRQIILSFLGSVPARIMSIREALERQDLEAVMRESHKLAGAGLFGFTELGQAAGVLEEAASHSESHDLYEAMSNVEKYAAAALAGSE